MRGIVMGLFAAMSVLAAPVYNVSIDTSSVSGSAGAIYLQFSPGLNADSAHIEITNFLISGAGALTGPVVQTGAVTGALDSSPLTMSNASGLNDYLHFLNYGDSISFSVEFFLPAVLAGDSGSLFSFGLTASDGISPILTSDPAGFSGQIGYDQNRVFAADSVAAGTSIASAAIPEPSSALLLVSAMAALAIRGVRRRKPGLRRV